MGRVYCRGWQPGRMEAYLNVPLGKPVKVWVMDRTKGVLGDEVYDACDALEAVL